MVANPYLVNWAPPANNPNGIEPYVPPFRMIRTSLGLDPADLASGKRVVITSELFKFLFGAIIAQGFFDERWYLETYPDVAAAIKKGISSSSLEHYINAGYYEGRSPGPCPVDCSWYEKYYVDLPDALEKGEIIDSADHFHSSGYFEGRISTPHHLRSVEVWHALLAIT